MYTGGVAHSITLTWMPDERDPLGPGRALEERRNQLGMSAREVGRRAGLSQTIVRKLETGGSDVRKSRTDTLRGLARALDWSLGELYTAIGIRETSEDLLAKLTHLEVGDRNVQFPVHPSTAAGDRDAEPAPELGVAIFSMQHLERQGIKPAWVRVFPWDANCYVSAEAINAAMIRPGDHLAIDTEHKPKPGDVAAYWWPAEQRLVLIRHQIERPGTVLNASDPEAAIARLPDDTKLELVGRFALRSG